MFHKLGWFRIFLYSMRTINEMYLYHSFMAVYLLVLSLFHSIPTSGWKDESHKKVFTLPFSKKLLLSLNSMRPIHFWPTFLSTLRNGSLKYKNSVIIPSSHSKPFMTCMCGRKSKLFFCHSVCKLGPEADKFQNLKPKPSQRGLNRSCFAL